MQPTAQAVGSIELGGTSPGGAKEGIGYQITKLIQNYKIANTVKYV